jgi:hypothetical protein
MTIKKRCFDALDLGRICATVSRRVSETGSRRFSVPSEAVRKTVV